MTVNLQSYTSPVLAKRDPSYLPKSAPARLHVLHEHFHAIDASFEVDPITGTRGSDLWHSILMTLALFFILNEDFKQAWEYSLSGGIIH